MQKVKLAGEICYKVDKQMQKDLFLLLKKCQKYRKCPALAQPHLGEPEDAREDGRRLHRDKVRHGGGPVEHELVDDVHGRLAPPVGVEHGHGVGHNDEEELVGQEAGGHLAGPEGELGHAVLAEGDGEKVDPGRHPDEPLHAAALLGGFGCLCHCSQQSSRVKRLGVL